jgi:hypothetical protein
LVAFFDSLRQAASFGWRIDEQVFRSECADCLHFWTLAKGVHTAICDAGRSLRTFELRVAVDGDLVRSQLLSDSALVRQEAQRLRVGFEALGWQPHSDGETSLASRLARVREMKRQFQEAHADGMRSVREGNHAALLDDGGRCWGAGSPCDDPSCPIARCA